MTRSQKFSEIGCTENLLESGFLRPWNHVQNPIIAAGQRHRKHPHRHHGREVERRDPGADADWLAHGVGIDAAGDAFGKFAFQQMRDAAGEFHHFQTAGDGPLGIGERLAVFARQDFRQIVHVPVQQLAEGEHHLSAFRRRRRRPAGQGGLSGSNGLAGFLGRCQWRQLGDFAGGRVIDIAEAAAFAFDPFTVDEMVKFLGNGPSSLMSRANVALWVLAALEARLDVIQHRHQIGDRVNHVMGAALVHGRIDAVAMRLLDIFGHCIPFVQGNADLVT